MEENKNHDKHEGHEGKKCQGLCCKCGGPGHKIVKIILVIVIALVLLCLGAAFGARQAGRYGNFNNDNVRFNPGRNGNWQENGGARQRMMRGNQINNQGVQPAGTNIPVNNSPVDNQINTGTSTPNTPQL
jgi:hypothetical protein